MLSEPDLEIDEWARRVIGAAIEVHRALGPGFTEIAYEEALAVELSLREIPFERQAPLLLRYKGRVVHQSRLDLLVGSRLVVELKAVDALAPIHTTQLISYLRGGGYRLGLLINFNVPRLEQGIRRIVLSGP